MAERAKHAFGALENIDQALANGTIDSYDILFVKDANGKPFVGWVDKDGNKVICDDSAEFEKLETELTNKVSAEEVDTKIDTAVTEKVETVVTEKVTKEVETVVNEKVETVITEKVDTVVNEKVETLVTEKVTEKVESTVVQALAKTDKYEVLDVPKGTLVDYNDKEIRIMVPHDAVWTKQAVGEGGDPNSYYATLRTYISNDDAVGYIEHLGDQVDPEILTDIKTDKNGRRYQDSWIALAKYDGTTWTYYGANSSEGRYIGWDYQLDLFDADGVMIESDSVRIGLANEGCYFVNAPYYVGAMEKKITDKITEEIAKIETKIEQTESSYEIIEF